MRKVYTIISAVIVISCPAYAIDGNGSINSGGQNRTFAYHAPGNAVGENLPLVIIMHGDGGTAAGIKGYSGFDAVADAENFIAVYPDAMAGAWNRYVDDVPGDGGLGNPNAPDDVQFIADLIDYFCDTYSIDNRKVYASGHSAGGFMAYNLAITLPNKIAAFAPVAASLWGDNAYITNHFTNEYVQVPIYHIHGDADLTVPYPDPNHAPGSYQEWPLSGFSAPNCNHNTYVSVIDIVPNVKELVFCDGMNTNGKKVSLIRIMGGGHGWPNIANYNAASASWQFFKLYELPVMPESCYQMSLSDDVFSHISISPVPAKDMLTINHATFISTINLFDAMGRIILSNVQLQNQSVDISMLRSGIYFMTISMDGKSKTIKFIKE